MRKIVVFVSPSVPVLFREKNYFSLCEILKLLRLIRRFKQYMKGFELISGFYILNIIFEENLYYYP